MGREGNIGSEGARDTGLVELEVGKEAFRLKLNKIYFLELTSH